MEKSKEEYKMACEECGTVVSYGKRKNTKRRLCIDCWKDKEREQREDAKQKENKKK
ncbi:MAG: hypothetical protein ACFFF4_14570 [Candidatus Thorarchaeota archaeon]